MNKIIYAVATLAIVGCVLATVLVVTNDSSDAQRTKRTKVQNRGQVKRSHAPFSQVLEFRQQAAETAAARVKSEQWKHGPTGLVTSPFDEIRTAEVIHQQNVPAEQSPCNVNGWQFDRNACCQSFCNLNFKKHLPIFYTQLALWDQIDALVAETEEEIKLVNQCVAYCDTTYPTKVAADNNAAVDNNAVAVTSNTAAVTGTGNVVDAGTSNTAGTSNAAVAGTGNVVDAGTIPL